MVKTKSAELTYDKSMKMAFKKIGSNGILTITKDGGKPITLSRRVSMEEGNEIKSSVEKFNKRSSDKALKAIIVLVTPEAIKAAAAKERTVVAAKGIKQQIKKEVKKSKTPSVEKSFLEALDEFLASDEQAVDKFQALLDKHKKVKETKEEPKARISGTPQPGEKYRDGVRVSAYYGYKDGQKMEVDREGYIIGEW